MPYKTVPLQTAKTMCLNFKSLSDEIKKLEKDKKNAAKVKTLQKDLEAKGKKIDEVIVKIIAETRKEFLVHAAKVDKWLGECVGLTKQMKEATAKFQKTHDGNLFVQATKIPRTIEDKAKTAKEDNDDFGSSWFELRGLNFTGVGYELDEKYNKNFYKARFELMGAAKSVVGKIEQMKKLHKEAEILANDMRAHYTSGQQDVAVFEEDVEDFHGRVKKFHKDSNDKTYAIQDQAGRVRNVLAKPEDVNDSLLGNIRARVQDNVSANKEIIGQQKVFLQELAQLKKFAQNPTPKAKQMLAESEKMIAELGGFYRKAAEGVKTYSEIFKQTTAILAKKKKK